LREQKFYNVFRYFKQHMRVMFKHNCRGMQFGISHIVTASRGEMPDNANIPQA